MCMCKIATRCSNKHENTKFYPIYMYLVMKYSHLKCFFFSFSKLVTRHFGIAFATGLLFIIYPK